MGADTAYAAVVTVKDGNHTNVYGEEVENHDESVTANSNTVNISGGNVTGIVMGGNAYYSGSSTEKSATANSNTVNISGGNVNKVWSGHAYAGMGDAITSFNTVNISGGTVSGDVYGGHAEMGANKTANDNIINLLTSGMNLSSAALYGYYSGCSHSGNTLNVCGKNITVNSVQNFDNMNFFLPTDMTTSETMLKANYATVTNAKIGVLAQGKLANLSTGDKVTLLSATTTLTGGDSISQTTNITVPTGIATVNTYTFDVAAEDNAIVATITSGTSGVSEDAKSVVETRAANTTFINAGADMLASQGFAQAANAVALQVAEKSQQGEGSSESSQSGGVAAVTGFTPFAALGGSSLRAESGSYVDTKGFGINVGFARELENSQGKLLFGPIVEYGGGKYDSYLDNGTHGDGKSHYVGIGIMARQINHDGFYYEGSLRGGRATSDYNGNISNQNVKYDSASPYFAAHLGAGKVMDIGHNNTVDGYLKYFYSHQGSDTVTMHGSTSGDESWNFDSVNSHRLRIGARLTHKVNERNSFYGGLAYQYEFGGEARAHYDGGTAPSPSVKGSSGFIELGWQVKPGGPVTLDLGINGWVGKQKGGSVQLGATWNF